MKQKHPLCVAAICSVLFIVVSCLLSTHVSAEGTFQKFPDLLPDGDMIWGGLAVDYDGIVWIGGNDIYSFDGVSLTKHGLLDERIFEMRIDDENNLWIRNYQELYKKTGDRLDLVFHWDGPNHGDRITSFFYLDDAIWVATTGGLFEYDGSTWIPHTTKNGLPENDVQGVTIDSHGIVWIATNNANVAMYDGASWTVIQNEVFDEPYMHTVFTDDFGNVWVGNGYTIAIYDGTTWSKTHYDPSWDDCGGCYEAPMRLLSDASGNVWAMTGSSIGMYDGTDWHDIGRLMYTNAVALDPSKQEAWIITDSLYRYDYGTTGVDESIKQSPLQISSYPNPANPITTLQYQIGTPSHISLDIYNMSGQKIKTLVDDFQSAGTHAAVFNGASYGSGMYFYRLHAGDVIKSGKFMVVK